MSVGTVRRCKLVDIAAKQRWALNGGPFGSKLTTKHYTGSGVPVIRGTNLSGASKFSFDDFVYVSEEKADELRPNNAHPGDIIFTQRGTIGQVGLIPPSAPFPRFVISQSQMKLTPDPEQVDAEFLYYLFAAPTTVKAIQNLAFSAGVPHINLEILRNFEVSLPPISEQRRIADILATYDELIENNRQRIRILEEMARALYREWFVELRFPGVRKASAGSATRGALPAGWSRRKLGEMLTVDKGVSYSGAGLTEHGNPMVNLKNVLPGGGFRRDATKPYSGDFKPRHTVKPGDVILANTDLTQAGNVIASPALIPRIGRDQPMLISHHLFAVRPFPDVPSLFLYNLFLTDDFRQFAKGFASGTTVLGLPKEAVLEYAFVCPPPHLIEAFVNKVRSIYELAELLHDQNENLRRARDFLLPKLLSGASEPS